MSHLSVEALLALREPGSEPGDAAARTHLDACELCRAELDRLHQRVARLKALPALRPPRDRWPAVRARFVAERRRTRARRISVAGLTLAASLAAVVVTRGSNRSDPAAMAELEISQAKARSRALEGALGQIDPNGRVLDGRTAQIADELEDRIAALDRRLQAAELLQRRAREEQLLQLWRERVGLLDALVDVHVTRASNVGL